MFKIEGETIRFGIMLLAFGISIALVGWFYQRRELGLFDVEIVPPYDVLKSLMFLLGVCSLFFAPLLGELLRLRFKGSTYIIGMFAPTLISLSMLGILWSHEPNLWLADAMTTYPNRTIFAAGCCVSLLLFISIFTWATITNLYTLRREREHADAKLVHLLVDTLHDLETDKCVWQEPAIKAWTVARIEEIASCVERDWPWGIVKDDATVCTWLEQTTQRKAMAIRELKKWVLNPKADSHENVLRKLSQILVIATCGDLDSLEMAPEQPASPKAGLVKRLWSAARVLPTAVIPGFIVWVFHKAGLLMPPVLTYAAVGSFIWACLTFMTELDPRYSDRLEAFDRLTNVLLPFRMTK